MNALGDTRARSTGVTPLGWISWGLALAVIGLFAVRAWAFRWIADDGIIVHRTVRNLLAGHGPVFNAGERVEANTSVLWTYVVAAGGAIWEDLDAVSIVEGIGLSTVGLLGLVAGCAVLYGGSRARFFVPVGVATYCALPAARDFASSGLENGLVLAWVGVVWWLLCRRAVGSPGGRELALTAVLVGLGPLVRPEAAVVTALAGLYLLATARGRRERVLTLAWAAALPALYQVFRMGFYGLPVPHTAMAKEAGVNRVEQGLFYWNHSLLLFNVGWFRAGSVLLALGGAGVLAIALASRRPRMDGAALRRIGPIVVVLASAAILLAYSVYNGGDYMRGRMTLFPLALALAPVAWIPVRFRSGTGGRADSAARLTVAAGAAVMMLWSGSAVLAAPPPGHADTTEIRGIVDERAYKVDFSGDPTPDDTDSYAGIEAAPALVGTLGSAPGGTLLMARRDNRTWIEVPPPVGSADPTTIVAHHLGIDAALSPLRVRVWDYVGLATPLAGHIEGIRGGRIGHDKDMPLEWAVASMAQGPPWSALPPDVDPVRVAAARAALACPEVRDLLAPATAPLTPGRFLSNIAGSFGKYSARIPSDPVAAAALCD